MKARYRGRGFKAGVCTALLALTLPLSLGQAAVAAPAAPQLPLPADFTGTNMVPSSPAVASTSTTRHPASAARRMEPPVKMASSSGWGWTKTAVGMGTNRAGGAGIGGVRVDGLQVGGAAWASAAAT